jgi:acyl-CoA synthetase (AMP-forming)/AMP-acid ligase II
VPEILVACAGQRPDVPVLTSTAGAGVTASALLDRTRRGAAALLDRGVRRGHFVAVDTTSLSWTEAAVAYFSITWTGAVAVLAMGEDSERVALDRIGATVLVSGGGRTVSCVHGIAAAALAAAPPAAGPPAARPEDPLDIVFTSGTTGVPKPVASTHAQWIGSVRPEIMTGRSRRVVAHTGIPIAVSGGLHGVLLNHLARGVTSLATGSAAELVDACRTGQVDELHLTPHAARALGRLTEAGEPWARRVRIIRVVGGPVPDAVASQLAERLPQARLVSLYGLTEGGAALCVKLMDRAAADSIGRPVRGTEVRVLDADGRELPPGQVGELAVRSTGSQALAYYQEESLTEAWFPGGWARTGDLGVVDPDGGEIRLIGRVKELIVLRGGRLRPEAVEEILSRRIPPGVEFAVAALPTPGSWDRIAVFLGGSPDSPDVAAARHGLADMTGPFRPHLVRVVPEIPLAPFGKPLRRLLTQQLLAENG